MNCLEKEGRQHILPLKKGLAWSNYFLRLLWYLVQKKAKFASDFRLFHRAEDLGIDTAVYIVN